MPRRLRIRVKASFGEVVIEGDNAKEVLDMLEEMPPEFMERIGSLVASRLTPPLQTQLQGVIELTTEGPIITAGGKLTHYEAIGLVLYACEEKMASAASIERLLQSSGVRVMVPARLNEMTKRSLVFKPDPGRPEFRLTSAGEKWVKTEVLGKLKKETS